MLLSGLEMKTPSQCLRKGLEALAQKGSQFHLYLWALRAAILASSHWGEDILSSTSVEGFPAAKVSSSLAYQESIPTRDVCAVLHGLQFLLMSSGQVGILAFNGAWSATKDALAPKSLPSPLHHVYGRRWRRSWAQRRVDVPTASPVGQQDNFALLLGSWCGQKCVWNKVCSNQWSLHQPLHEEVSRKKWHSGPKSLFSRLIPNLTFDE